MLSYPRGKPQCERSRTDSTVAVSSQTGADTATVSKIDLSPFFFPIREG